MRAASPYLLFLPAIVLVTLFKVWPLVVGYQTSLTRPRGLFDTQYVGWTNYSALLQDPVWRESFITLSKVLAALPVFVLVPLLVAAALFHGIRGWRAFRAIFFLSWLLPPVMVGQIFDPILGFSGPLNAVIHVLGVKDPVPFLVSPTLAPWTLIGVVLWSWFGLGTGIYLAGFATLPTDHVDAARIDGAGPLSLLWWVEIPHLLPTMTFWTVICTASMFLGLFAFVYSLTGGGPGDATSLPEFQIWRSLIENYDPGYTAALGLSLFVVVALLTLLQVRLMFTRTQEQ